MLLFEPLSDGRWRIGYGYITKKEFEAAQDTGMLKARAF